ncbi:hypothetical protein KAZ66_01050 [Candidatus Woesebacteria bacterium]|jgi:hypothetical protein|nr:hypothetical protein [Candidatus Woesebacteria bacterium]
MAITRQQFLTAQPGQVLVSSDGTKGKILENRCNVRETPCLFVEHPEFGAEEIFLAPDGKICDDDFGVSITGLNDQNAHIADS